MAAKKKVDGRGGARPGAGRPTVLKDRVRFMVHLERADLEALQELADEDEVSVGQVIRDILSRSLSRRRR
jgi:hypothetical protein